MQYKYALPNAYMYCNSFTGIKFYKNIDSLNNRRLE